jgi:signal transduction histidine kinase
LRTPVTALLGNVDYAARYGADAEVLADLRHDAERLARLVDSLLALERAGAAGTSVTEPVALDELARSARGEGVRLGTVQPVRIAGDRAAVSRALGNLVENGLVHGDGVVTVSVVRAGDRARMTVRDEGPGPGQASHEHLFQRFWRGEGTSERPGAGLGLSIVAAIAAQHGGRVLVDGSAFTVELPALDDPPAASGPQDECD